MTAGSTFSIPLLTEEELIDHGRDIPPWRQRTARFMFGTDTRLAFYRALAVYRGQDIRESTALVNWWNIVTGRGTRNLWHPLAILIPVVLYRMHELGERWQAAFRPWIPASDAMIFTASEQAGLTPRLLDTLITLTLQQRTRSKLIRQSLGPALVNFAWIVALLAGVGLYYFPALKRSMPHMRLVGGAATLQSLSDFVTADGPFVLMALAALPFFVRYMLDNFTGPLRAGLDGLPLFGGHRQATGMTCLLGLSALLEAGGNFRDGLQILRRTATPYMRERIDAILAFDDLRPADAMAATGFHWPDDATIELLTLYMETKDPQTGIRAIVNDWFDRAGEQYALKARIVSTIGQLVTWGLVGWLYLVTSDIVFSASAAGHAVGH
jgi:hypothetical protein